MPVIRRLVIRFWSTFYPIYKSTFPLTLGLLDSKPWYPLVNLADFFETSKNSGIKLFDEARVDTPAPQVFPIEDQTYLISPHDHYVFPAVYVTEILKALVYGGTNLVFTPDEVICHDEYNFEADYTSEELWGRHMIDTKRMRLRLIQHDLTPDRVAVAASFVDAVAPNYAHWLTEVLPRIVTFCQLEQFRNVPIFVNDGLHRNILESLALIVGPEREVIALPVGRAIQVERLLVTSATGYVPFERRNKGFIDHSHGKFSPTSLKLVNETLDKLIDFPEVENWPEKIFIRRNSDTRKLINGEKIEFEFARLGFAIIEPENLTFIQQFILFRKAKIIVGSSGAALANLCFSNSKAKIVIFIGRFEHTSYWYWQNMACSVGNRVNYVLGKLKSGEAGIHSSYSIEIDQELLEFVSKL